MRARTNISLKNRYTATLTDFKGVDLNTSPLRVAPNRASSMKNFICDNGILHKRPGWEEQFRIFRSVEKTDADGNTVTDDLGNAVKEDVAQEIHAIFPFSEDGNEVLLIHAGDGEGNGYIYRAENKDGKWEYKCQSDDDGIADINENRASCFYRGGKAYIAGCGNFLCYGKHDGESYKLCEVSEIAYAPKTSINLGGGEEQDVLDQVNLITRKRINTLVGPKIDIEDRTVINSDSNKFELDAACDSSKSAIVEVEGKSGFKSSLGSLGYYQYELKLEKQAGMDDLTVTSFSAWELNADTYGNKKKVSSFSTPNGTVITNGASVAKIIDKTLTLNFGVEPLVGGLDNITVTFYAAGGEEYVQRLKNCRFGTTFGVNGANDRLFLAGNPDHPNMDFWSEANDFTYFPDTNTMEVGSAHAAINGYARLSDTTLAVLKEGKAGEPTIFYRTGAEKHDTANLKYDAYFPVAAGIAGDGIVNHHAGATLAGDVMVVTRSGVRALVLSSNVASGERYMHERSRPIYRELVSSGELANAAGIVYRNRYYLALPKAGKCYVADAHYKAAFDGSTDYNYEWWVWDNVHATCFAEYEDKLLFGTPDGLICAFVEGTFADRTYTVFGEGDLLCEKSGRVIYNKVRKFVAGDRVVLKGDVYARLGKVTEIKSMQAISDSETKEIVFLTDNVDAYYEGQTVCADNDSAFTGECTVHEIDVVKGTVTLRRDGNNFYNEMPKDGEFYLLEGLDGEELYVNAVDKDKGLFTVSRGSDQDADKLFLCQRKNNTETNESKTNWTGLCAHAAPVCAEWVTPVMDFGTNASTKTLLGVTVATEPGLGTQTDVSGVMTFGYETRRQAVGLELPVGSVGMGLDFSGLDFNNFSFGESFACSYTRRMNVRNFNFIVFRFGSDIEQDCAVSGVTLQYKINCKNIGLR